MSENWLSGLLAAGIAQVVPVHIKVNIRGGLTPLQQAVFMTADLASMESEGTLLAVVLHEMAHVMGFGTL
ncbi:MAG: hypothetical protein FJW38_07735 [Acidobacteria bacterium]|nr:hypothetical protein [Acidobacteriota bacterium]